MESVLAGRKVEKRLHPTCELMKAKFRTESSVIAGSPTMAFGASEGIMQFLDSFSDRDFSGKLGEAFDTQLKFRMSGNAA
jgi:hypothetical protein